MMWTKLSNQWGRDNDQLCSGGRPSKWRGSHCVLGDERLTVAGVSPVTTAGRLERLARLNPGCTREWVFDGAPEPGHCVPAVGDTVAVPWPVQLPPRPVLLWRVSSARQRPVQLQLSRRGWLWGENCCSDPVGRVSSAGQRNRRWRVSHLILHLAVVGEAAPWPHGGGWRLRCALVGYKIRCRNGDAGQSYHSVQFRV